MNMKDLIPALLFSLAVTFGLQYFFSSKQSTTPAEVSGQKFSAPRATDIAQLKPLYTEVDFSETRAPGKPTITMFETDQARYEFSTEGASLQRIDIKRNWGGSIGYLSTVNPPGLADKEQRCFLVALEDHTPYYYELVEKKDDIDRVILTYKVTFDQGSIIKKYIVAKHEFKIDMALTFEPKPGSSLHPRIFFPSPDIAELADNDTISALANSGVDRVAVSPKNEQLLEEYWSKPNLFGTQDRYFIHAMVTDRQNFVQRGYYKVFDLNSLTTILEGPEIKEPRTYEMVFYFGPKEYSALTAVDVRLIETLNYGWLSFVSRPVSKILLDILNFFYDFLKNYGLAIIVLTILMKLVLLPFSIKAEKAKERQEEFQKKLKYVEQRYKGDTDALTAARAELIRKYGMPGIGGCLPLLLQLPLFMALATVLANSIELYRAPFLWISDLSAPDPLYILPVLTGLAMLFTVTSGDIKQKLPIVVMSIVFIAFTANLSAGLALYILTSSVLGLLQNYLTKRFA